MAGSLLSAFHHVAPRSGDFDTSGKRLHDAQVEADFGPEHEDLGTWRVVVRDPTGNVVEITDAPATPG